MISEALRSPSIDLCCQIEGQRKIVFVLLHHYALIQPVRNIEFERELILPLANQFILWELVCDKGLVDH